MLLYDLLMLFFQCVYLLRKQCVLTTFLMNVYENNESDDNKSCTYSI